MKLVNARRRLLVLFGLTACVLFPDHSPDATVTVGLITATTINQGMIWFAPQHAF